MNNSIPTAAVPLPPGALKRLVNRFAFPAERPFVTLTLYYGMLILIAAVVLFFIPASRALVSGERLEDLMQRSSGLDGSRGAGLSWSTSLDMALAMVGAFLLMMPTSWVYMAERRRKGFDQGMVQTMIVLSLAIAGVVVIVRNSTALAFSLAGIVAAVRFRNTLAETRDSLYIFAAIGVGLAAGVQALAAALILSAIFNVVTLLFWRGDYGMCELGRAPGYLLVGTGNREDDNKAKAKGKGKKKNKRDFNAILVVRADDTELARPRVDGVLATECSRFELAEIEQNSKGRGVLKYRIRLGKKTDPRYLEDALLTQGAPQVIGARIH